MENKSLLIVISGFGGAGKGTINKELEKTNKYAISISCTTREKRAEDVEGSTYFFKTRQEFENMSENNEFIEWVEFCDNYYGTPKAHVESILNSGKNVILEIEVVGAKNIKEMYSDAVLIYILPPSITELKNRLKIRGESDEYIKKRLTKAVSEIEGIEVYDYIVINDTVEKAVKDIINITECENKRRKHMSGFISKIKEDLKSENNI